MNAELDHNGRLDMDPTLFDSSENNSVFLFKKPGEFKDPDFSPKDENHVTNMPLLFLDDGQVIFENGDSLFSSDSCDTLLQQSLLQNQILDFMDTEVGIQDDISNFFDGDFSDLIEVMTTYKCRACPYRASLKEELVQHFTNLHGEMMFAKNTLFDEDTQPETDNDMKLVFLCGQCNSGFVNLDDCREHMVKDHSCTAKPPEVKEDPDMKSLSMTAVVSIANKNGIINPLVQQKEGNPPPLTDSNKNTILLEDKKRIPKKRPRIRKARPCIRKLTEEDEERILSMRAQENKNNACPKRGCTFRFSSEELLDRHLECHILYGNHRDFQCSICDEGFAKWHGCALHLWHAHHIDVDLLTCSYCQEYKTVTQTKLQNHMKIHGQERSYKCNMCDKCFKQKAQLHNHEVTHLDRSTMRAPQWYSAKKCSLCSKTYSDSKCLKKHIQAVHSKLKPFICHICGHSSARKAMLQLHMRQHTGDKPYSCPICDYRTGDHNVLRRHKMIHTGHRPYKCPYCPSNFIQSTAFKHHITIQHPGKEGVYTCSRCSFDTVTKEILTNHEADHDAGVIPKQSGNEDSSDVFPGNVAAAHLVYQCFNTKPPDIRSSLTSSSTSADGNTQTITIAIPTKRIEDSDDSSDFFSLKDDDFVIEDLGGTTIPAEPTIV